MDRHTRQRRWSKVTTLDLQLTRHTIDAVPEACALWGNTCMRIRLEGYICIWVHVLCACVYVYMCICVYVCTYTVYVWVCARVHVNDDICGLFTIYTRCTIYVICTICIPCMKWKTCTVCAAVLVALIIAVIALLLVALRVPFPLTFGHMYNSLCML